MTQLPTLAPPKVAGEANHDVRLAPRYKVLLHDDDVTPFLFVQHEVCEGIFHMDPARAYAVTSEVHHTGVGIAGIYSREQAEFKCEQVRSLARGRGYPLQVSFEPA